MLAAIICREYGWTWQEFQDQPADFIEVVVGLLKEEGKQRNKKSDD